MKTNLLIFFVVLFMLGGCEEKPTLLSYDELEASDRISGVWISEDRDQNDDMKVLVISYQKQRGNLKLWSKTLQAENTKIAGNFDITIALNLNLPDEIPNEICLSPSVNSYNIHTLTITYTKCGWFPDPNPIDNIPHGEYKLLCNINNEDYVRFESLINKESSNPQFDIAKTNICKLLGKEEININNIRTPTREERVLREDELKEIIYFYMNNTLMCSTDAEKIISDLYASEVYYNQVGKISKYQLLEKMNDINDPSGYKNIRICSIDENAIKIADGKRKNQKVLKYSFDYTLGNSMSGDTEEGRVYRQVTFEKNNNQILIVSEKDQKTVSKTYKTTWN